MMPRPVFVSIPMALALPTACALMISAAGIAHADATPSASARTVQFAQQPVPRSAYGTRSEAANASFNDILPAPAGRNPPAAQPETRNAGASEKELQMRMMLMQRSMGFGGIFGPTLNKELLGNGGQGSRQKSCGSYTDHAACQAYKSGDRWAADRLQQRRSTPAERDWYNR